MHLLKQVGVVVSIGCYFELN